MSHPSKHINGIDWLRAFSSVFIVMWHMHAFGTSDIFSKQHYTGHQFDLSDFINFHILLVAVPLFIAISCYLFALKNTTNAYFKSRMFRIVSLLIFWVVMLYLWNSSIWYILGNIPLSMPELVLYIITGGHTIYYFFVCLLFCTILCFAATRLQFRTVLFMGGFSCLVIISLPLLAEYTGYFWLSAHWNPLNFLPYPFASVLIARFDYTRCNKVKLFCGLTFLFFAILAASILEWHYLISLVHFKGQGYAIPAYTRLSVFFSAYLILVCMLFSNIKTNFLINYMSERSLALFCLHPFFIPIIARLSSELPLFPIQQVSPILVICMSYMASHLLSPFIKESMLK